MFRRSHKLIAIDRALALLAGVLLVSPTLAAEKTSELQTGETAILAALDEKTEVDFIDEPLQGVVDYFKHQHGIEIQVDTNALEDVNMGTDTPVTKRLRNITLRSALNLILRDLDLTWTIGNEVLLITSPEEAELLLVTRVYDVGDLVTVQDPEGNRWQDFDSLIRAIVSTVDPDTWEDVGGPGSIAELECRGAKVLVVRQTLVIQEQIGKLLKELEQLAEKSGKDVIPTRKKPKPKPAEPGFRGGFGGGGMGGMGGGGGGFLGGGQGGGMM